MDRWTVDGADAGARLDKFLASAGRLGTRGRAADALARGKIYLNDREATMKDAGVSLAAGDVVRTWMDRPGSAKRRPTLGEERDLPIVHEDSAIVVLNKPAGLLAVPLERREDARSVYEDLKDYLARRRKPRPFVVHRIDRDTSGLVFAKTARAATCWGPVPPTLGDARLPGDRLRMSVASVSAWTSPGVGQPR